MLLKRGPPMIPHSHFQDTYQTKGKHVALPHFVKNALGEDMYRE